MRCEPDAGSRNKFSGPPNPEGQVPNSHILTQNLYYKYYYPKPKYLIIGYLDPLNPTTPRKLFPKPAGFDYSKPPSVELDNHLGLGFRFYRKVEHH